MFSGGRERRTFTKVVGEGVCLQEPNLTVFTIGRKLRTRLERGEHYFPFVVELTNDKLVLKNFTQANNQRGNMNYL